MDRADSQLEQFPKAIQEIKDNTFVDDVLSGENTVEIAANLGT
jgi:hypothetical protein